MPELTCRGRFVLFLIKRQKKDAYFTFSQPSPKEIAMKLMENNLHDAAVETMLRVSFTEFHNKCEYDSDNAR